MFTDLKGTRRPTDYPRAEIARMAHEAIAKHGGPDYARVFFKFTCGACGTRCAFEEPNRLFESGVCAACGHTTAITMAGFALHVSVAGGLEKRP